MKFYSTKNKSHRVDLKTAVLHSLPPDNGLYMPESIVPLDKYILENIDEFTFQELSYNICHQFLSEDLSDKVIRNIISSSITFDAPGMASLPPRTLDASRGSMCGSPGPQIR